MDLNLLKFLVAVCETGTVHEAAARLSVTSSAVSQALKRLEKEAGAQLFVRVRRRVLPSPAGLELMRAAQPAIVQVHLALERLASEKREVQGSLRVGAPTQFGSHFLVRIFSEFSRKYPKVSLKLKLGSPRTLIHGLLRNELDLAYCDDGPYFEKVESTLGRKVAFKEELVLACSSEFFEERLSSGQSFGDLITCPHVDYVDDHSAVNIWYRHHFKKVPKSLRLAVVSENVQVLIRSIKEHIGLGMVPTYMIKKEVSRGELVTIEKGTASLKNPILLLQLIDKVPGRPEKLFVQLVEAKKHLFELATGT